MRSDKSTLTVVASLLLLAAGLLILYAAVDFGPTTDGSAAGWWAFGIGILLALVSGVVWVVDFSLRHTRWPEVIISAGISVLFFVAYLTWIRPVSGDPVIFHPGALMAMLSGIWMFISLYCWFRVART